MLRLKSDLLQMTAQAAYFQERCQAAEKALKESLLAQKEVEKRTDVRVIGTISEEHF